MKRMMKIVALVLVAVMMMAMSTTAFAQTVGTAAEGKGSITINNAAKGEKYCVMKLFDATVGADGKIAYTGTIPESLNSYFTKDSAGNITKTTQEDDEELIKAVNVWALIQSVTETESDGSPLTFEGLDYGYYAVKSSQGAVITIDSTNPKATIYDKNTKEVVAKKTVDKESYSIGDTITYTATFDTVNYLGEGENFKQVTKYVISDTLPEFLSDPTVTSITIGDTAIDIQRFTEKSIVIPWVTGTAPDYTSLYNNGAKLVITYTAKLTSVANIDTANTNTVTIQPYVYDDNEEKPWKNSWSDDAEVKTYAAALKKTDGTNPLAGAQFTIKGLTVTGSAGEYTVVSYNSAEDATESAVLDTDANGKLYIVGLASDVNLTVTEYKAPDGYNKLTTPTTVTPQLLSTKIYKESGTIKYDAKGNVIASNATATTTETVEKNLSDLDASAVEIVNNAGTELPSTGGMGTTILYAAGGVLVLLALALLIAKGRAGSGK